jgi:glutamate/tyrosine decarboxylase-like PLP-dependent enzyme
MKRLWIGTVELLTEPGRDGHTRAFTNVIAWANELADYKETVESVVSKYQWTLLTVEHARPIEDGEEFNQEINEIIATAKSNANACIVATLHYHPSRVS